MIYRAIGIMSGSSLDGLDIAYVVLEEIGGKWNYAIEEAECLKYTNNWIEKLSGATRLSALDYQLLHVEYGHFIGQQVVHFIEKHQLAHKVHLIASHGHTTFHLPQKMMTAQIGDGAAIAAETKLPVVSELRSLDVAFGGQGAPIVPIGEKLLFNEYDCFLNIGGIANISFRYEGGYKAFDICAANRVLNMLANEKGLQYDEGGQISAAGIVDEKLLLRLNELDYYKQAYPKSLSNSFGTDIIYPLVKNANLSLEDALRTYVEHIVGQIAKVFQHSTFNIQYSKMLVSGGGAFNTFLLERLRDVLSDVEIIIPDKKVIEYKEALIMALIGVLRWREEVNVLSSVTGATQNSIGGALWLGNTD